MGDVNIAILPSCGSIFCKSNRWLKQKQNSAKYRGKCLLLTEWQLPRKAFFTLPIMMLTHLKASWSGSSSLPPITTGKWRQPTLLTAVKQTRPSEMTVLVAFKCFLTLCSISLDLSKALDHTHSQRSKTIIQRLITRCKSLVFVEF